MSPAITARGETPFPEAGEGVYLRFTNADLKRLQQDFGTNFVSEAHDKLEAWDFEFADRLLAAGCKKDGEPVAVSMDDSALNDVPVAQTFGKLIDAVFLSYHGETFRSHIEKLSAIVAEMNRNGEIPPHQSPDTTLSTNSVSGPSDTESDPRSSGA